MVTVVWNTARNRVVFVTTNKAIAESMRELLLSLGEKPHVGWSTKSGFGLEVEACDIEWTPRRFNPFRTPVKAVRVQISPRQITSATYRVITSIEPGPDVETACIAVDSPNRTYLCGHEMIPTHKTTSLANSKLWAADHSLLRPKRIQAHGYAAGLHDAGELPEDCTVRLLVIPVDGTFADWWAYEEKFTARSPTGVPTAWTAYAPAWRQARRCRRTSRTPGARRGASFSPVP